MNAIILATALIIQLVIAGLLYGESHWLIASFMIAFAGAVCYDSAGKDKAVKLAQHNSDIAVKLYDSMHGLDVPPRR